MSAMTLTGYDRFAEEYQRWWLPVLAPTTLRLLDDLPVDGAAATLVDVGSGTGILPVAALTRWPSMRCVAIDASAAMLDIARSSATEAGVLDRLETHVADAASLPIPDGSADVVTSSFAIQLVDDRAAVLADVLRVLRPGGTFAGVTWRAGDEPFEPEESFYDVVDALEIEVPDAGPEPYTYESGNAAAAELTAAGFVEVSAEEAWIQRQWRPVDYLDLLEHWTADAIFEPLSDQRRSQLRERTLRQFARLPRRAFAWRAPIVRAVGRRPAA
jgi:SAM-dependent methyltransferase